VGLLGALALGWAAVSMAPALAGDEIVSADKADPCLPSAINLSVNSGIVGASTLSDLLSENTRGGPVLSAKIRKLALSDASKIREILIAARTATPDQVTAIGAGLADVIRRCGDMQPELAAQISDLVASAKFSDLSVAFVAHLPAEDLLDKRRARVSPQKNPEKKIKGELSMTAPPPPPQLENRLFMAKPEEAPKPSTAEIVARTKAVAETSQEPGTGPYITDSITPGPKFQMGAFTIGKPGLTFSTGGGGGQTEIGNNTVSPTK
jgi:hypothetical protein